MIKFLLYGGIALITKNVIRKKYQRLRHSLNEKSRRLWCAAEALAIGKKGVAIVHAATQISRPTIYLGIKEIQQKSHQKKSKNRIRKKGGGAKLIMNKQPEILDALEALVEPATKGNPESPLRWTNKGLRKLSVELKKTKI